MSDFKEKCGNILTGAAAGGSIGAAIGAIFGGPITSALGAKIGGAVGTILGALSD